MPDQTEPLQLENCSLDDVIAALLSGTPIGGRNIEDFQLPSSDSLKIFAYYTQHRDLWPRNRQVQGPEIDGLLKALDSELPQTSRTTRRAAGACPVWNLRRVEAHRFGGLHRHCGPAGEDPEPFVLEIDKDLTLISGFNGAGKTALLSSIIWCLTGKALRSQHMPDEVHEPMTVEWIGEEDGAEREQVERNFTIPPIVPIPSASNLEVLGDQPKLDTWVRLTFVNAATGESRGVTRRLVAQPSHRITMAVEGLAELGLTQPALEVGTLMPGIAAHMRFDEKTDFAQAIAQLTGMKPLEDLGKAGAADCHPAARSGNADHRAESGLNDLARSKRRSGRLSMRGRRSLTWESLRPLRHRAKSWTAATAKHASRPLEPAFRRHNVS